MRNVLSFQGFGLTCGPTVPPLRVRWEGGARRTIDASSASHGARQTQHYSKESRQVQTGVMRPLRICQE
jgi:hypothetical protein